MTNTLTPIELLALSKIKPGGSRAQVEPGIYIGTVSVEVDYDLTVGEDYEQEQVNAVPWQEIVMVLLSKQNDVTLKSVLREVLDGDLDVTAIKAEAKAAMAEIMGQTKQPHKGKVNGTAVVSTVLKGLSS